MAKFVDGVFDFQSNVYPQSRALFEELANGQSPEVLFITCADSRIDTGMITQRGPGELFVCRNAGNIVPPATTRPSGMVASIEYAVAALNVPHVVICGHSGCGAMAGAMNPEGLDALPQVKDWLNFSTAAVAYVKAAYADKSPEEQMKALIERNVLLQLQHLRTHPSVAARLARGDIALHGWVYDIGSGGVDAYDADRDAFVSLGALKQAASA